MSSPCSLLVYAAISWYVTLLSCDDPSPADYWRVACVEMEGECETRTLEPLESLYRECRGACTANMTDRELRATPNPDGGQCLTCNSRMEDGAPSRGAVSGPSRNMGCQCLGQLRGSFFFKERCKTPGEEVSFDGAEEFEAVRRRPCLHCQGQRGEHNHRGCPDIQFTRVCDDETATFPFLLPVGAVLGTFGVITIGVCFGHGRAKADAGITSVCGTLTAQSRSGARWEYKVFAEMMNAKRFYRCVVVTRGAQGATNVNPVMVK